MMIYADNAATTRTSRTAINAMLPYFDVQYGNPSSLYTLGQKAREALENARAVMARRLNAEQMVVVKSCSVDPALSVRELGEQGVIDPRFAELAEGAAFPIAVVHKAELERMRAMLLGEPVLRAQ